MVGGAKQIVTLQRHSAVRVWTCANGCSFYEKTLNSILGYSFVILDCVVYVAFGHIYISPILQHYYPCNPSSYSKKNAIMTYVLENTIYNLEKLLHN